MKYYILGQGPETETPSDGSVVASAEREGDQQQQQQSDAAATTKFAEVFCSATIKKAQAR